MSANFIDSKINISSQSLVEEFTDLFFLFQKSIEVAEARTKLTFMIIWFAIVATIEEIILRVANINIFSII